MQHTQNTNVFAHDWCKDGTQFGNNDIIFKTEKGCDIDYLCVLGLVNQFKIKIIIIKFNYEYAGIYGKQLHAGGD